MKLMNKLNSQKQKYKNVVFLLSEFIDQLINEEPNLVDGVDGPGSFDKQ